MCGHFPPRRGIARTRAGLRAHISCERAALHFKGSAPRLTGALIARKRLRALPREYYQFINAECSDQVVSARSDVQARFLRSRYVIPANHICTAGLRIINIAARSTPSFYAERLTVGTQMMTHVIPIAGCKNERTFPP